MKDTIGAVLGLVVGGIVGYWVGFQGGIFLANAMNIDNFTGRAQTYADVGGIVGVVVLAVAGAVAGVALARFRDF